MSRTWTLKKTLICKHLKTIKYPEKVWKKNVIFSGLMNKYI